MLTVAWLVDSCVVDFALRKLRSFIRCDRLGPLSLEALAKSITVTPHSLSQDLSNKTPDNGKYTFIEKQP